MMADARRALRVVYVAGSGHTGSTLLAMLLDSHPQIASVGEVSVSRAGRHRGVTRRCSCGVALDACAFWQKVFEAVRTDGFPIGPFSWPHAYSYKRPWAHRLLTRYPSHALFRRLQEAADAYLPLHRGRIRRIGRANVSFIRAVLAASGADVFVDASKSANRLQHLLRVAELEVSVIQLVRDVRGFVASAKRRGDRPERAARIWKSQLVVMRRLAASLPRDRVLMLRYEDLCDKPGEELARLHRFIGVDVVPPPTVLLARDHHVLGNRIRRTSELAIRPPDDWRTRLSEPEVTRVMAISGDWNRAFGYA